jgi:hypothetical protein
VRNQEIKGSVKKELEFKLEEVKLKKQWDIEDLKNEASKKKAQRQFEKFNKAVEVERQREVEAK